MSYRHRIRDLRADHDLNQKQVAAVLHIAQTTYSDYEKGKLRMPVEFLIRLAHFYDVDMDYICGLSTVPREFPKQSHTADSTTAAASLPP